MNNGIVKHVFSKMNDDNNKFINSNKFIFMGNLHQQIIAGVENGNSIYNRFEIDSNIVNNYKQYSEQLINFIKTFFHKTFSDFIQDDFCSKIEQIQNIIRDIYTELYGKNEQKI